jgi:hypothetical protein
MKFERADYLNFAKAGLIVAAAMGLVFLISLRLPGISDSTREVVGLLVFFPGVLIFAPIMLPKGHNIGYGYFYMGAVLNWVFYTSWVSWFIENRRRRRELNRAKPSADVASPDRLPPDQSAK